MGPRPTRQRISHKLPAKQYIFKHKIRLCRDKNSNLSSVSQSFKVVYFHRKPRRFGNFSIEILFEGIRRYLPAFIKPIQAVARFESKGFFPRLLIAVEAAFRQGDINHVTGDVHFLTLLLRKRKTVLTIHDCAFMEHPSAVARLLLRWFWLKLPVARAAVITTVSQATKDQLLQFVDCNPEKIVVIHNFISPHFRPNPKPFAEQMPVLLQIGTAPNKNLERLAQALQGIGCRLHIVGKLSDTQRGHLAQHQIYFTNATNLSEEELRACYNECDLVTFVSTYEGFGLPILEAQAIGRPVITSRLLSMPEVAGDAACLVDPFNVAQIRQGILKIIEDTDYREKLIRLGFENVQRFHPQTIADQYVALYQHLRINPR